MRVLYAVAAVVAVGGCNAVFDLAKTQPAPPIDAEYFDAPADAPFACPTTGVPEFSPYLHQAFVQSDCRDYNESVNGFGVATCTFPAQRIDGKLVAIPELDDPFGPYGAPRISPEGDTLFVTKGPQVQVFTRTATRAWVRAPSLSIALTLDYGTTIGVPSAGPLRRMMLKTLANDIHELEFDAAGNVTEVYTYAPSELGATTSNYISYAPSLSPDGLHVVFVADTDEGYQSVLYGDRASTSVKFAAAQVVHGIAGVNDPFITADCGQLYFSAVGSVAYVKQ